MSGGALRVGALAAALAGCAAAPPADAPEETGDDAGFTVVTFNTGTTPGVVAAGTEAGWTEELARLSDAHYGDGLAWRPALDAVATFFGDVAPDVVAFQEIFPAQDCGEVPEEARAGFVCEGWTPGDPGVPERVLGEGWTVACHPGKPDKCLAVRHTLGTLRGCDPRATRCDAGLVGYQVDGCGRGARVARGVVERAGASPLTVVSVHGTSGFTSDDRACRVAQLDQVFVDLGDGAPGASGEVNLVLGDFNTDPGRLGDVDESAARLLAAVDGARFSFLTDVGLDAPPTYGVYGNIDHVIADHLDGGCTAHGVDEGTSPVLDVAYFDHVPIVCTLRDR